MFLSELLLLKCCLSKSFYDIFKFINTGFILGPLLITVQSHLLDLGVFSLSERLRVCGKLTNGFLQSQVQCCNRVLVSLFLCCGRFAESLTVLVVLSFLFIQLTVYLGQLLPKFCVKNTNSFRVLRRNSFQVLLVFCVEQP